MSLKKYKGVPVGQSGNFVQDDNGEWVPQKGTADGAQVVQLTGSNLEEQLTESDAVGGVLTFAENISVIEIYNTDAENAGVFTVNGLDITVPANEVFQATIGGAPSPTVTVTGATTYIVSRYE